MECMEEGATSFLMKPYDQQTLLKSLQAAVDGGKS
jgi:FixJ family two-component response regulator